MIAIRVSIGKANAQSMNKTASYPTRALNYDLLPLDESVEKAVYDDAQ